MSKLQLSLDQIEHSEKLRASQTAEILAARLNPAEGTREVAGIAPNDKIEPMRLRLERESKSLMLVGHLPYVSRLAARLLGLKADRSAVRFWMGGTVRIERDEGGRWIVGWVLVPKLIEASSSPRTWSLNRRIWRHIVMKQIISNLLERYELGKVNRRRLIQSLAAIAASAQATAAGPSTFHGVALNHIAIRVTNVSRSRDFYQKHLGLPLLHESQANCFLGLGKNFLTLFHNPSPGLDHFCIAIENFNADTVVEDLRRQGLNPTRPSGSDRVYFPDPDSLTVQLSSLDHHA